MDINPAILDRLLSAEIASGHYFDRPTGYHRCLFCQAGFEEGRIHPHGEALFTAAKAADLHVEQEHGGAFNALLNCGKTQTGISATQAALLSRLNSGESDRRVAEALQISVSTVRNHRFQLRRKAREAKVFLAVMNLFTEHKTRDQDFLELPATLTVSDERTQISVSEAEEIRKKYLATEPGLHLRRFPKKEKLKLVLLLEVARLFETGKRYSEPEVNRILRPVYEDYGTIRRYLVDYGLLKRTASGSEYWRES